MANPADFYNAAKKAGITDIAVVCYKDPFNKELLQKLKINPTTVITVVNGEAVTEDAKLDPKDDILIMSVVSGG